MSYCRWTKDSDVYVFVCGCPVNNEYEHIDCCGCKHPLTYQEAIDHIKWHISKGDKIPEWVIPNIEEDMKAYERKSNG